MSMGRSKPARAAAGPSHASGAARRAVPTGAEGTGEHRPRWARSAVVTGLSAAAAVILLVGGSVHATAGMAFTAADPAIEVSRQQRPGRAAERPALTVAQLAELRDRSLEQRSRQIDDNRQRTEARQRQRQLADTAAEIAAEAERLRNLGVFFWPTAGGVSSGFGYRIHPILRIKRLHNGADIGGTCGQPIWAAQSGTVTKTAPAGYNGGSGHNVRIEHGDINGVRIQTAYLHMDKIEVKPGQRVAKGERIGTVGSTGLSTACHLHLTLYKNGRASDPLEYIRK